MRGSPQDMIARVSQKQEFMGPSARIMQCGAQFSTSTLMTMEEMQGAQLKGADLAFVWKKLASFSHSFLHSVYQDQARMISPRHQAAQCEDTWHDGRVWDRGQNTYY